MRAFFLIALMLTAGANLRAQAQGEAKCSLTPDQLSQAAELKGLWPGMTVEQVKSRVPSLEMGKPDAFGLSKTSFSPDFNPKIDKTAFQGVRTISLDFLDGQLFSVWVGYNEAFSLKGADEVIRAISKSLKLQGDWETKSRVQQTVCGNFRLAVSMIAGSPTLRITDETILDTWEKRRAEREALEP